MKETSPIILPSTTTTPTGKETLIRDTFRAKNSPTRTLSKDFYQTASPLKRTLSAQSELTADNIEKMSVNQINEDLLTNQPPDEYPPISTIPFGRRVTRSDLVTQPLTLGRMMVAIHKVS